MSGVLSRWWRSLRPYSFTASLMPVSLALVLANRTDDPVLWWTVPVFALAALLFHAGTNVLNDYYDHLHGVDSPDDRDPTHLIPRGEVSPGFMLLSGRVYFVLGLALGAALTLGAGRGSAFFLAGVSGASGAFLYTGRRFSLKYVALGDPLVFFLMGPVLVAMGVWAFTGSLTAEALTAALPIALLVTVILQGNNLRDLAGDRTAGIDTPAVLVGVGAARRIFITLLSGAYGVVVILVMTGTIPLTGVLPFATIPMALRLIRSVRGRSEDELAAIQELPRQCAALHFVFGLLYVGGIALSPLTGIK